MRKFLGKCSSSSILTSRNAIDSSNDGKKSNIFDRQLRKLEKSQSDSHSSIVTIVLVEANCLPPVPNDGISHSLFCKFSLGTESHKTKAVASTIRPVWNERFTLRLRKNDLLNISVWNKGKHKNFMGSCILDVSVFETDRTHEIWKQLDDGYGFVHLSITVCLSTANNSSSPQFFNLDYDGEKHNVLSLSSSWQLVGLLYVKIFGAKGLVGKPNAYCILEVDNERVQTPTQKENSEPTWNKCYVFNVYDVTSTLDLKVYNRAFLNESMGKVSIPLLMIANREQRWYALKDKNKLYFSRGNYPRVCLQMTLVWNPIKASLSLFYPKPVKYIKKPKKFDVALVYSNIVFVEKTFNFLCEVNENFKRLFEWDDREYSTVALVGWLIFWFYFRLWTVPLWLLVPFIYHWLFYQHQDDKIYHAVHTNLIDEEPKNTKVDTSLAGKLQGLQTTTLVVTNGIEYIASVAEKLKNLVSFKVPFLSYLTMILLVFASLVFYFIPFNYLLMILGVYKYARKYLNPDRVLNNDLLDFISRIPNDEILKDWKELSVPEPVQKHPSGKLARSISTGVLPL